MSERRLRDLEALTQGLARWCAQHRGSGEVTVARPSAGWSNDMLLVAVGSGEDIVVRLPNLIPAFPDTDPAHEAAILELLRSHGLPVPAVVAVETDDGWLGSPFLVMQRLPGRPVGEVPGLDPWLVDSTELEQRSVQDQLIGALVDIHRIHLTSESPPSLRPGLAAELDHQDSYVQWAADGQPSQQIQRVLAWCRENTPTPSGEPVLLWGDPRLGNMLYDESHRVVTGLLDWELASFGPPEMDLAWYLSMEELTAKSVRAAPPGFHTSDAFLETYTERSGASVQDFGWHRVFALARAAAINDREARVAERTGERFPGVYGEGHPLLRQAEKLIDAQEA